MEKVAEYKKNSLKRQINGLLSSYETEKDVDCLLLAVEIERVAIDFGLKINYVLSKDKKRILRINHIDYGKHDGITLKNFYIKSLYYNKHKLMSDYEKPSTFRMACLAINQKTKEIGFITHYSEGSFIVKKTIPISRDIEGLYMIDKGVWKEEDCKIYDTFESLVVFVENYNTYDSIKILAEYERQLKYMGVLK